MRDAFGALGDGARRVNRAPVILVGLSTLMLATIVQARIALHVPLPVAALWIQQMLAAVTDARGVMLLHGTTTDAIAIAATSLLAWLFLTGGVLDRYARDRAVRAEAFFASAGVYFFRFLRLTIAQIAIYSAILALVDSGFAAAIAIGVCSVVSDYARVRSVVEDRRSMLGAVVAAAGFIRRNAGAVIILFVAQYAIALAATDVFAWWADPSTPVVSTIVSVWVKALCWASETALFQRRLAHAGYVSRADAVWPESPAAEAIG
jgi:hypothetical protein